MYCTTNMISRRPVPVKLFSEFIDHLASPDEIGQMYNKKCSKSIQQSYEKYASECYGKPRAKGLRTRLAITVYTSLSFCLLRWSNCAEFQPCVASVVHLVRSSRPRQDRSSFVEHAIKGSLVAKSWHRPLQISCVCCLGCAEIERVRNLQDGKLMIPPAYIIKVIKLYPTILTIPRLASFFALWQPERIRASTLAQQRLSLGYKVGRTHRVGGLPC
jgi:hypothetical protein